MKVWTVHATSYEIARDVVRSCDFEDFSPYSVHRTRDGAVAAVVKEMNLIRKEAREDEEEDKLPGFTDYPDVKADEIKWDDCPTYDGKMRWKTYDEHDETVYVMTELELED